MNIKKLFASTLLVVMLFALALPVMAHAADDTPAVVSEEVAQIEGDSEVLSSKAMACAITIGLAAGAGAIAMALASQKASEGIARQPEAAGQIRSAMMLSLVFIETAIIYALLVVIMVIFVL